jgi:signal transduction histidine kinase
LKYTNEGITLAAAQDGQQVRFSVTDTGIGISKSDQKRLFEKFFRSEDYRTRESSGTGLGLYVTLKLASKLSAKVEVASQLNKGSTFSISVPSLPDPERDHPRSRGR